MGCWGCMLATVDNCELFVAIFRLLWIYVGYNDYMWLTVDISFICYLLWVACSYLQVTVDSC